MSSKDEEELEDDQISLASDLSYDYVEASNCGARLQGFAIRLIISLIVIGAMSGALIWSFKKGEKGTDNGTNNRDASKNFSIFINEYTTEGTYSVTFRQPDSPLNQFAPPQVFPSFWIQDNDHQRLVHRRDNETTVFAFASHSFRAKYDKYGDVVKCYYTTKSNYTTYINQIGLANLTREHSAYESTHNHEKVFIYNGDPTDVVVEGTPQDAFLVTAYADAHTGALLGWDTYFTASNSSRVYLISYAYDKMTPGPPESSSFDPPVECSPNSS